MNRSAICLNKDLASLRQSSTRSISSPILSISTWLSLLGYLGSLAMTQTVYGEAFMAVRWVMLGLCAASGTADIILASTHGGYRTQVGNGQALMIYLFATFITVIYAENWLFSGMRWASHAIMLSVLMLLLPRLVTIRQIQILLAILKYLMAALIIVSWIFPAPKTYLSSGNLYQGAMGDANSMGHISFIAAFLFLQGFVISKVPRARFLSGALAVIAMVTVWHSGARSSMIAFSIGVLLLSYYYRREMNGIVMVSMLLGSLAMVSLPKLPQEIFRFAEKSDRPGVNEGLGPVQSRAPVWSAAYEGFKKRPVLGWGFGADSSMSRQWEVKLTALGTIERDAVNDFLFMMEGSGLVGLGSYLLLIYIVLKQRPSEFQRSILRHFSRAQDADTGLMPLYHAHVALFVLPVCLLVLNQFDNSALSAGSLISVTLWLSAGCAAALRHELG